MPVGQFGATLTKNFAVETSQWNALSILQVSWQLELLETLEEESDGMYQGISDSMSLRFRGDSSLSSSKSDSASSLLRLDLSLFPSCPRFEGECGVIPEVPGPLLDWSKLAWMERISVR